MFAEQIRVETSRSPYFQKTDMCNMFRSHLADDNANLSAWRARV
jgi:hypothetical protein